MYWLLVARDQADAVAAVVRKVARCRGRTSSALPGRRRTSSPSRSRAPRARPILSTSGPDSGRYLKGDLRCRLQRRGVAEGPVGQNELAAQRQDAPPADLDVLAVHRLVEALAAVVGGALSRRRRGGDAARTTPQRSAAEDFEERLIERSPSLRRRLSRFARPVDAVSRATIALRFPMKTNALGSPSPRGAFASRSRRPRLPRPPRRRRSNPR